jgi:hypothetical protein
MSTKVIFARRPLFDDEEALAAENANLPVFTQRTKIPSGSLVIGRYSVLPYYREVEEDIKNLGSRLINNYDEHRYIADLQNWYGDLEGLTPKTWFDPGQVPLNEPGSFVLKGETNSKKFLWKTHMFARTRADIGDVLVRLSHDSLIQEQKVYARQYVPLKTYFVDLQDLPITEEYRFFVLDGQVLAGGFYWAPFADEVASSFPSAGDVPKSFLGEVIRRVGDRTRFWVVDVGRTANGDWIVIELNDGQMSGLSMIEPGDLYNALQESLQ